MGDAHGGSGPAGRGVDPGGFALVIASALCYSCLGILGKIAFRQGQPLPSLLASRFTIAALALWMMVWPTPSLRAALARLTPRRALGLVAWGFVGFAGQSALYFSALGLISASLDEVLLYTCPAFVALLIWARTRRRPPLARLLAIVLALLGTALCAGPLGGGAHLGGACLAVLAGLWYAAFLLVLHRLTPGVPGILSSALIVSGASGAFDLCALVLGYQPPRSGAEWAVVLGLVLSATTFGIVLFVAGLKRVGPEVAAILSTFEPLGTLVLAFLVLGERLVALQWFGAALIIGAAFVLASTEESRPAPADEARDRRVAAEVAAIPLAGD